MNGLRRQQTSGQLDDLAGRGILLEDTPTVLDKHQQSVERFGRERHSPAFALQQTLPGINAEGAELVKALWLTRHNVFTESVQQEFRFSTGFLQDFRTAVELGFAGRWRVMKSLGSRALMAG